MIQMHDQAYREDLGDGFVVRWATPADEASLIALYNEVFKDDTEYVSIYAMEMFHGRHPLGVPEDFAVVADASNRIVAATFLMRMPIEYAGVTVQGGRPEVVATHPDMRNRGFIRKIFQLIHARSTRRGDLVQGITGIPYYYRQFGYEYALTLGGMYQLPVASIPASTTDDTIRIKRATTDDIMHVLMLYERDRRRHHRQQAMLVTSRIDATYLRYAMSNTPTHEPWVPYLITTHDDRVIGSFFTNRIRFGALEIKSLTTEPNIPLNGIFDALCRQLVHLAQTIPTVSSSTPDATSIQFWLGVDHPAYALVARYPHQHHNPYGWYIRVADVAQFVQHIIAPIERRLSQSQLAGYTGTLQIDMYRDGLQLDVVNGKITASPWQRTGAWQNVRTPGAPQAGYPPLLMLQQIFGLRSIQELRDFYPDVYASHDAQLLLDILFPKQPSWLLPLD